MQVLSPTTNLAINSVRIGQQFKVEITAKDLNLIANKKIALTYVLSVLPKGSNTPITVSGKITGLVSLPISKGGAAATTSELASLAGSEIQSELVTVPDFMPEGTATLTLVLATSKVGTISLSKTLNITL